MNPAEHQQTMRSYSSFRIRAGNSAVCNNCHKELPMISRYSNPKQNLRTQFERIITRAGHQPWPRLFQNLRAIRETELMARFPAKDVATWLGNREPVAMMHYAMATKASFESAKTTASSFGSNAKLGEAKSEARNDDSDENTKQNAKQHRTEKSGAKSQRPGKNRDNRDLAPLSSTADHSGKLPEGNPLRNHSLFLKIG